MNSAKPTYGGAELHDQPRNAQSLGTERVPFRATVLPNEFATSQQPLPTHFTYLNIAMMSEYQNYSPEVSHLLVAVQKSTC